ncbi:MAG: GxxExxY protein [Candidatus Omnitrophota bacterium]|nr:GxxExxY protein [Candidatus Omnitrophota bacterium]
MAYEELSELTSQVIGAAIDVHKALGPGFTEHIYARALRYELSKRKVPFVTEQGIRIKYKGESLGLHRLDLVVGGEVVVELKAVYEVNRFHIAQVLSYLKASGKRLGLVVNFAKSRVEVKRVAL